MKKLKDVTPKVTENQRRMARHVATIQGRTEPDQIDFQHAIFCQTALPYTNPGDDVRALHRDNGNAHLRIEAGAARRHEGGTWHEVGLPYGPKARLVLLHIISEAKRTGERKIEVADSLTGFTKSLGLCTDGRTIRAIKDQLTRLAAANIRISLDYDRHAKQIQGPIVDALEIWDIAENQRVFWPSYIHISEQFYRSVVQYAVPHDHDAIAALQDSAMALDVYGWLAHRLRRIPQDRRQLVTWQNLYEQFGHGYSRIRKFREKFRSVLKRVLAVYPAAQLEDTHKGLYLYRSNPPVRENQADRLRRKAEQKR